MTKSDALAILDKLLKRVYIGGKDVILSFSEMELWKREAKLAARHIFGDNETHAEEADRLYFWPIADQQGFTAVDQFHIASDAPYIIQSWIAEVSTYWPNDDKPISRTTDATQRGNRIFIGHGGSPDWRDLKDFLQDRLKLEWDEFNREPVAGIHTAERLQQMLDQASFAFLVMTAEDERADGTKHARENVIHEIGLFQGKLGFNRAIILLEHGCKEFSNIVGLTQIRFSSGKIKAEFEEIRRVLEREGLLKP